MCYQIMATKCLKVESMKVCRALRDGDVEKAREAVSMIVGRDTAVLSAEGITKAAVETVAENTSDGSIAPLFFMLLGGPAAGFAYKAVNTMDSMLGYKNEKYLYFGRPAARLDDVVNFIPSRLAALLMIAAAWLCGMDGKGAFRIWRRDRFKHASPQFGTDGIGVRRGSGGRACRRCRIFWQGGEKAVYRGWKTPRWNRRILPGQTGFYMFPHLFYVRRDC